MHPTYDDFLGCRDFKEDEVDLCGSNFPEPVDVDYIFLMLTGIVILQSTWTIGLAATAYTGPPDAQGFGASWIVLSVIAWSVRVADIITDKL